MSQQIRFFELNKLDITNDNVSITASDSVATNNGEDFADYMRNRVNTSGYVTTGSSDSGNTTLEFNFGDTVEIDTIIIIEHNLKAYTIQYWNGSTYVDFSSAISESTNSDSTTFHTFTKVTTSKIKLICTGTIVADSDKFIRQFIATESIGQLTGFPVIKSPRIRTGKIINKMLSGKVNITDAVGAFECELNVKNYSIDDDLDIIETLYFNNKGFLMWLCGGDESQFSSQRIGYRLRDIYLMRAVDDYRPEWVKGVYVSGINFTMKLQEVIG